MKIIVKLSIVSQPKKMSSIRFIQITLLLALLMMNRLASPRAVDSGSKIDKGECVCSHRSLYFYYVGRPGNEPILISSDSINVLCFLTGDIQLIANDAKSFLDKSASNEKRGVTEECDEGCTAEEVEEVEENREGNFWR